MEYNKITDMLTEYAASPMAKAKCRHIKPHTDSVRIETLQAETRAACMRLEKTGNISFAGLKDIGAAVKRLEVSGNLGIQELTDTASVLDMVETAISYNNEASSNDEYADCLTGYFTELVSLSDISRNIHRVIISETEIADDASSALKNIRREKRLTNERLHSQLSRMLGDSDRQMMFQENLITMRNGRYCIPIKSEYKNRFPGMIHDQSGSGSTVFIEPMVAVNLNNELKELENRELVEIENILAGLSEQAAAVVSDIRYDYDILIKLDFIFARAKFAKSYNGIEPVFNTDGIIDIKGGIHPFLDRHTAVPVNIRLGEEYNMLIVTGPNTGGKTVSLKTVGLFTLMGQSGLHVPANEGTRLAVFRDVFADIGDEQSIEQNLSTFSSHMSNIVYIVNHVTPDTLCLFDEPGGGTDPVEGAALAMSILSFLNSMNVRCMATTHYSELKTFAMSTPGVENAGCEFDLKSLKPTYRLITGIPGKSNAFAISRKLGLPDHIIEAARSGMDNGAVDFETLIAELEQQKRSMEDDLRQISRDKEEIQKLKERLIENDNKTNLKRTEILTKAREEASDIIEEAKDTADNAIKKYNKWLSNPKDADIRDMEQERNKLRENLDKYNKTGKPNRNKKSTHTAEDFKTGDTVHVISMDTTGTITAPADSKGNLRVSMGILNASLPASDLELISTEKSERAKASGISSGFGKAMTIRPEINLLGLTVAEATYTLDKYLDDAALAKLHQVTVIHGKGTGALRNGIHEYLKKAPHVKSFRPGAYGEGDAGVTVVELK